MSLSKDAEPRRGSLLALWDSESYDTICERGGLADLVKSPHAAAIVAGALVDAGGDWIEALVRVLSESRRRGWVRVEREVSKFLLARADGVRAANRANAREKRGKEKRADVLLLRFDARVQEHIGQGNSPIHARELVKKELNIKPDTLRKYRKLLRQTS
jgi:hypothetical protein